MIKQEDWTIIENPDAPKDADHKNIALLAYDNDNLIIIDFAGRRLMELWDSGILKTTFLEGDRPDNNGIYIWEGTTYYHQYHAGDGDIFLKGQFRSLTESEWSDLEICGTEGPWDSKEY